ncbi:MAG: hypothetical protein Q9M11_06905 [Mariprofundaceae bacterium]|nr:hypothetical protein [Mariprofundaceae bacterium]
MTKDEVQKKNQAIWDMYSNLECLDEKYDDIFKGLESMILSSFTAAKIVPYHVRDGISFLFVNSTLDLHTHILSVYKVNCSNCRGDMLYGDIPAIVVGFSKVSLAYEEISARDLRIRNNGKPTFRGRLMQNDDKVWFAGDEQETWDVRFNGHLIWCKEGIDSVDNAAWYFVLPLAAVDSLEDARKMILQPLQELLQGVSPDNSHINFSKHTVQFSINNGVWTTFNNQTSVAELGGTRHDE